jgi:hypothetical protein
MNDQQTERGSAGTRAWALLRGALLAACTVVAITAAVSILTGCANGSSTPAPTPTVTITRPVTMPPTREQVIATCWLLASKAYPSWPENGGPMLDKIKECSSLTTTELTSLRNIARGLGITGNGG